MGYEDQQPQDLTQAATSPNVAGALQTILLNRMKQVDDNQQRLPAERQAALEKYQSSLQSNPYGTYGPAQHQLATWASNIGKGNSISALGQGVGAGLALNKDINMAMDKGNVASAKVGYDDVTGRDKLDVQELSALKGLVGKSGSNGLVTKMDKDGNMVTHNPATGETKVVHSSQRGEYQRIWSKAYEKAVSEQMDNPEQYAHGVAANVLGTSAPGTTTQFAGSGPAISGQSSQPPAGAIQYQDKPELKRREEFATGLEKGAIKDFEENVKPQAAIADSMLNTIGMLKQIPRTQDMFAPWREKLGAGLQAIGMDGNMVNEAESLQQVRPLLAKIANDRLLAAKGVQTEGDAQRSYNEFLKITDTQKAADFMYAWTEELANRNKFRKSVWEDSAQTEGTMGKAGKAWENTDYSKTAPVAILNGKPWTYTAWRNAFVKANPDVPLNEAISVWNKLARGEK